MTLPHPETLEPFEVQQSLPDMTGSQIDAQDHLGLIKAVAHNSFHNKGNHGGKYMNWLRAEVIRAKEVTSVDSQDLCQEGYFGLEKAAEKFDPTLGFTFSTFAVACIAGSIRKSIHSQLPIVYPRSAWHEVVYHEATFIKTLPNEDVADTASYADGEELDYFERFVPVEEMATTPLYDSEDVRVNDEMETVTSTTLSKDLEMILTEALRSREREIIKFRFGFEDYPRTLTEVAKRFSISRERVRVIQERAIAKLRAYLYAYRIREPFNEYDA